MFVVLLFMFVFYFVYSVFLNCFVYCFSFCIQLSLSCLCTILPTAATGGNPVAVNKYHIKSNPIPAGRFHQVSNEYERPICTHLISDDGNHPKHAESFTNTF